MNFRLLVTAFLFTSCAFKDCLSQFPVTTYSSKSTEVLRCKISSQVTYTSWTETAGDGRTIAIIYEYNKGSGITPTSPPTEGKYSNFVYDYNEDVNFDLVIENVNKDDGGIYSCISIPGPVTNSYAVQVEALPDLLDLSCSPSPSRTCGGPDEALASSVDCTCTAREVSPQSLQLQWSIPPTSVIRNETQDAGDYFNLISEVTITPTNTQESVTCSLTGYQSEGIDSSSIMRTYNYVPPECTLQVISFDSRCTTAAINCECTGGMPETYIYSFFSENKDRISDSEVSSIEVDISGNERFKFYCRGCNGIYGETSLAEKADIVCTLGTSTSPPTTRETGKDSPPCPTPGLIVICCVEGLVIIVMISSFAFLYAIRKGSKDKNTQSLVMTLDDATDKINTAYMDLHETIQVSSHRINVDIPIENLTLQAPFPGKGVMVYQIAEMTLTSKKEKIVVKTVSDDAPVKLEKLHADEAQKLTTLTSNVNVAKFLGRCNNVPNLLCYEFVNGTKLGEYLRENFQPSKIHQYGNTKQKRYHVPEQGSVESLPRISLQIARGMKYLTAQKFLHPGLRSEKVIIDVSGQCKLYDFVSEDNAKDIIAILWGKSVPYQWMPPEYLFLEKLGPSVDVWSFGVLVWEIFSYGALPHEGKGRNDVEKELRGKENLPLPSNCPGAIWQITLNCWDQSPEKRPSFDHLTLQLSHMCNDNKEYDEIPSK